MTGTLTVPFRGEQVEIEFEAGSYEPDTNGWECIWSFVDKIWSELKLTDEEDTEIYRRIAEYQDESYEDYD